MIDLLLSDRADERRSLFEEAAGIGLYRDRKHSTERRLEETAVDLQRVEDLIAEVQSQIRSLARQRGKAERHAKLTEERFAVQLTLARRLLERLSDGSRRNGGALRGADPAAARRADARGRRRAPARGESRGPAPPRRASGPRSPGGWRACGWSWASSMATSRSPPSGSANAARPPASARRTSGRRLQLRAQQAAGGAGGGHRRPRRRGRRARADPGRAGRASERRRGRAPPADRAARRGAPRASRSCSSRRRPCGRWRASGRRSKASSPRSASASPRPPRIGPALQIELADAERRRDHAIERAGFLSHEAKRAAAEAEHARHLVAETREREAMHRADRRQAEEALAQMTARRNALEELERDRVGLAPARRRAAGRPGPVRRRRAGPAQRLRDHRPRGRRAGRAAAGRLDARRAGARRGDRARGAGVARDAPAGRAGPAAARSRALRSAATRPPLDDRLRAQGPPPAGCGPRSPGSEVLDAPGRVLRRASGAIFLSGAGAPSGPLRRRAELASLVQRRRARRRRGGRGRRRRSQDTVAQSGRARAGAGRSDGGRGAGPRGRAPGRGRAGGRGAAGRQPDPGVGRLGVAARPAHRAPRPLRSSG